MQLPAFRKLVQEKWPNNVAGPNALKKIEEAVKQAAQGVRYTAAALRRWEVRQATEEERWCRA
eukprot:11220834-Lingulodinium_polyedra.AAC.1